MSTQMTQWGMQATRGAERLKRDVHELQGVRELYMVSFTWQLWLITFGIMQGNNRTNLKVISVR